MILARIAFLAAALAIMCQTASANDSAAEVAIGGLTLMPSRDIALENEELFISVDAVRVSYRFRNTTKRDIELLVAFPLPELPNGGSSEGDIGISDDWSSTLAFSTLVDGEPVKLGYRETAIFKGSDITARLNMEGINVFSSNDAFHSRINALSPEKRQQLISEGLISEAGYAKEPLWTAHWSVQANVTRKQVFPAGKVLSVEHRYKPVAGGSVGGGLEPQARMEGGTESGYFKETRAKYCIDDGWLASFDRVGDKKKTESGSYPYSETWLGYVLKSGANWKGPIRNFRLVVDKGAPENMVSFCATGVKKMSPTQFEVRYRDFEPKEDLNILIIRWAPGG
jgi:hypothetical protein